jgi:hypothetical protein
LVVVSVTVVTDVLMVVVVDGVGVCVVVGSAVVVGVTVVVTVVGGGGAAVLLGSGAAVWVAVLGGGTASLVGADDVVAVMLLEVTAGLCDVPALVNFTTAKTSNASIAADRTPRPISAAGRWNHGVGGGTGSGYRAVRPVGEG